MEIRLFRGNRVPLSPRELPVALALARVTPRSQFATAKLALSAPIAKGQRALPRAMQRRTFFRHRAPGGRQAAWTQRRGAGSWSPRSSASPAGDRAALRLVYAETSAKLFGVCLRILGDRSEAEDVLQDVYLTVWRKAASFDESVASPITWLVAIARNRSIDRLRSGRVVRATSADRGCRRRRRCEFERAGAAGNRRRAGEARATASGSSRTRQSAAISSAFLDGLTYDELARQAQRAARHHEELDQARAA